MKKYLVGAGLIVAVLLLISTGTLVVKMEKLTLRASSSCTKAYCGDVNICCNSCFHEGWVADTPEYLQAVGVFEDLPLYPADGCGSVGAELVAWGLRVDWRFYVVRYETVYTDGKGIDKDVQDLQDIDKVNSTERD